MPMGYKGWTSTTWIQSKILLCGLEKEHVIVKFTAQISIRPQPRSLASAAAEKAETCWQPIQMCHYWDFRYRARNEIHIKWTFLKQNSNKTAWNNLNIYSSTILYFHAHSYSTRYYLLQVDIKQGRILLYLEKL